MPMRSWLAAVLLFAPALSAQTLVVPNQTGLIDTAGQSFAVQYTPGADSGGFDFTLTASPTLPIFITAATASVPNGLATCTHTASSVTCGALAVSPANDLGAGTITVTYNSAPVAGAIALSFSDVTFGDQDGNPEPGTTSGGTLTLPQGVQAPLAVSFSPTNLVFGASTTLSTSGGSGAGVVAYAVTAGPGVCTVSGALLDAVGVGTCTVSATKAGDANYLPASASIEVTVARATQATLTALADPATIPRGGGSALSTVGGSGSGAVTWAVTAGVSVCSVSGSALTGTGVGQCTVTATRAGDANYLPATASSTVSVVNPPGAQSLSVPDTGGRIDTAGQAFTIQYVAASGAGGFDFQLLPQPAGRIAPTSAVASIPNGTATCDVSGGSVSCSVAATTAGVDLANGSITVVYSAGTVAGNVALSFASSVFRGHGGLAGTGSATGGTLALARNEQAALVASASPPNLVFGGTAALSTSGGSGTGAVTWAVTAGAGVCAVSGSTLTATGVGNCTLTATKAADASFNAASASVAVGVAKAPQAALTASASPATILRGGSSALASSGGSGGGTVSWAVTAGASVCSVSGSTLSGIGVGQCTVTATKAADAHYLAASAATQVTVNSPPTAQALSIPNAQGVLNAAGQQFVVEYTPGSDSGGFDFTLNAAPAGRITITGVAHAIPNSATSCSHTASSVICVATATLANVDLGQGTITVTYTAGATAGPVSLAFGAAAFFTQTGVIEPGSTTGGTLSLPPLAQAPLVASASPATVAFGGTASLAATGGSGGGAVTWAVAVGGAACSVSGSTLTATAVGQCTVTATKAGDATYAPASASTTVSVVRAAQAALIASAAPAALSTGGGSTLSVVGGSGGGAVSWAVTAGASSCAVNGSTLAAIAPGICTATATKAADANHEAASASVQVTVQNALPTLSLPATVATIEDVTSAPLPITVGDAETSAAALVLSATSSDPALIANAVLSAGFGGSGASRSLVVTPVSNANGSATITVSLTDADGGVRSAAVALTVTPVNDAPSFAVPSVLTTAAGASGALQQAGFVLAVSLGPPDEQAAQSVQSYVVSETSDPQGVVSAAALAPDGTLSLTLSGTPGIADFSAVLTDSGGTADGGVAQSAAVSFRVVVPQSADLEVSLGNALPRALPGDIVAWEMRVANAGPSTAAGSRVTFAVPAGVAGAQWTCSPIAIAACPATGASGGIDVAVDLPFGGVLRFVLAGTVQAAAGAWLNATATVATGLGLADPDMSDNVAVDNDPVVSDLIASADFEPAFQTSVPGADALPQD